MLCRTSSVWLLLILCLAQPRLHAEPPPRTHAMWVYDTEAIAADPAARAELFLFCAHRHIVDLFWQTHFSPAPGAPRFGAVIIPNPDSLRAFNRAAAKQGLRIHALTGDPAFTEPDKHSRALARVEAVLEFDRESEPDERFAGIHFDIEPHGLKAWKTATHSEKCQLLTQLVEVSARIADRIRAESPNLVFGADVAWWFDKTNPDGTTAYPVTFRGVTRDATRHLLDLADNIGIMSYRNTVEGSNGMISLVSRAIPYADSARGRAFVGVKMADIGPSAESFYGSTETEMLEALRPLSLAYAGHPGFAGFAYFNYEAYRQMPQTAKEVPKTSTLDK